MNKFKAICIIIGLVVAAYIMILAVWQPFTTITYNVASNISAMPASGNFTGAVSGLQVMPWALMFVPAVLGMIAVVGILRSGKSGG